MNITKTQPDALNYQVTIDITPDDYAEALKKRLAPTSKVSAREWPRCP